MEKKLQDAIRETKKLNCINNQLKQAMNDKDKMIAETTRLNIDLQSQILDEFNELKGKI